jgi:outer membrane protein
MKQGDKTARGLPSLTLICAILLGVPAAAFSAAAPLAAPGNTTPAPQQGKQLTMEDVVRIAIENHSTIKSAQYQVDAQDAILHQQMSAYYPTITFNNAYATRNLGGGTVANSRGIDVFSNSTNVAMTLYNFGKREALVQSARETLGATEYAYQASFNNIVLAAKTAYLGVLQAQALLSVSEQTVRDREVTLTQSQGFYDVGTKPRSDVTQAEANLYIAQAGVISARNSVGVAWAQLRNAMGVDNYPEQPLSDDLTVPPVNLTLEQAKTEAFAARPELLQFSALLKAQDELLAFARRNYLPDFLFNSSYGRQSATFETPRPNWEVQLSLNVPLFNGFQTAYQVQQALANYRSIKEQERVEKQQVALQVEQSYRDLLSTRDAIGANEAAVKAAKENLELHVGRYEVGYAPIVEVTDAQTTYTTAQTNYVNALIAHKLALVQLVNAMGQN